MPAPTLNEVLASLGWTTGPGSNALGQGKNVYDSEGTLIGQLTAAETWELFSKRNHTAGVLCPFDCDDCDEHRATAARIDARERRDEDHGDWLRGEGKDARIGRRA